MFNVNIFGVSRSEPDFNWIRGEGEREGEGGDYSREAVILNISVKEGRLFEGGD